MRVNCIGFLVGMENSCFRGIAIIIYYEEAGVPYYKNLVTIVVIS